MSLFNKIAIGAAQFGMDYGKFNESGLISQADLRTLLQIAKESDINTIDTAVAYGDSEANLGNIGVDGWQLITKLPSIPDEITSVKAFIESTVSSSLSRLKKPSINGLLLHDPKQLLGERGIDIYSGLNSLKDHGYVSAIGVSIYNPEELDLLLKKFSFDIVQAPYSIIDQRMEKSAWLEKLQHHGIEFHARSIFLQGLLLQGRSVLFENYERWSSLWNLWFEWLEKSGISSLQACLNFALSNPLITKVVIGMDSLLHFKEILSNVNHVEFKDMPDLSCDDKDLIIPSNWQKQ